MVSKLARSVFFLAALAFVGTCGYEFYMESVFPNYPEHVDLGAKRVVPYHWKSTNIYVTAAESERLGIVHAIETASLIIGGLSIAVVKFVGHRE